MAIQRVKPKKTLSKSNINASEVNFCARISKKRENNVKNENKNTFDATYRRNCKFDTNNITIKGIKTARELCLWRSKNKLWHNYRKNSSCRHVQGHLLRKELQKLDKSELILTCMRKLWFPK